MSRANRAAGLILGIYAGLLGTQHGDLEVLQCTAAPDGVTSSANRIQFIWTITLLEKNH